METYYECIYECHLCVWERLFGGMDKLDCLKVCKFKLS